MDTPQVTDELIGDCARELLAADAVLGLARDGGWWVLGVTEGAMADCLREDPDVAIRHRRCNARGTGEHG